MNNEGVKVGDNVHLGDTGLTIAKGPTGDLAFTANKVDVGGNKVENVANGNIAADSKDAINGGQIHQVSQSVANALGGNSVVTTDGTVSAPTYVVGNQDKSVHNVGDAITELNKGWTLNAGSKDFQVQSGDKVSLVNTDKNINITQATDGTVDFALADSIKVKEVNADTVNAGTVKADQVKVGNVTINKDGINAGGQKVTNVAAGKVSTTSTDAVNGSQLYTTNSNTATYLGGGSTVDANGNTTAPTYNVIGGSYNNVGDALSALDKGVTTVQHNLDQAFNYTNNRINKLEDNLSAGIAATAALEQAPFVAGKWTYAAGASYYNDQSAIGATLRRTADNGRWSLSGGVAGGTTGSALFRVGISGVID